MAASLRALRGGQPGALAGLWTLCFTYGFVHAAGPGHGKLVIGGYGLGARVPVGRLMGLAVVSSLAQALSAVVLVYLAIWVFGWGREQVGGVADGVMAPISYAMIAGVGLWLFLRGGRKALALRKPVAAQGDHHAHAHDHHGVCASCGHAHAPTPAQAAAVRSVRDAVVIVGAIAIRPCTGALFLLILTYALGLVWAGIVGVFIMGIGTASLTGLVALTAVGLRESALSQVASGTATARILVAVEILVGGVIALLAMQLLLGSL
ncbi:nickel/cobalt transporter [Loktanella sp. 3ANDIMAR09]|uniref:nickel/cobalt transporter n=1 Tax=Loktanella sp. 3ANDIMAR09 TaxID=1225657 RepID=UPI00345F77D1